MAVGRKLGLAPTPLPELKSVLASTRSRPRTSFKNIPIMFFEELFASQRPHRRFSRMKTREILRRKTKRQRITKTKSLICDDKPRQSNSQKRHCLDRGAGIGRFIVDAFAKPDVPHEHRSDILCHHPAIRTGMGCGVKRARPGGQCCFRPHPHLPRMVG